MTQTHVQNGHNRRSVGVLASFVALFRRRSDEIAASDRQGVGGVSAVGDFLVTREKSPALSSPTERSKTYDQIKLNTAIVAAGLRYFSALMTGIRWHVRPAKIDEDPDPAEQAAERAKRSAEIAGGEVKPTASKSPKKSADQQKADDYAKIIERNLYGMDVPWYRVVRNAAGFRWDGYSIQEMIARRMPEIEAGYIGIGTVEARPCVTIERWKLEDRSGIVIGWVQRDPNDGTEWELDRDKCVYVVDDTITNAPDGVGLLRHVVELCGQLKRLEQLEGWTYETDLRGVPVGYAPTAVLDEKVRKNQLTQADADRMVTGIKDFITNHLKNPQLGILLDSTVYSGQDHVRTPSSQRMWAIDLLKGQGVGLGELNTAIVRKQHEIARALGVEQFMLGGSDAGSHALSEDKTRNLLELVKSTIAEIAWALRQDYVLKIFELNRWDRKYLPELMPEAAALRSVSVIVEVLSKLSLAGATIDRNDPVINQIRQMLSLVDQPYVTPEMMMLTKPPNSGGTPGEKSPNKPSPSTGKDVPKVKNANEEVLP